MSNLNGYRLKDINKGKPFYKKKWFFWVIGILVFSVILSVISINVNKQRQTEGITDNTKPTHYKMTEMDYKETCKKIDYKTLARNPNKYKGDNFKITGEVEQVVESDDVIDDNTQVTVRLNMTKDEFGFWDDEILLHIEIPKNDDRILEDDIITVWGTCQGKYSYEGLLHTNVTTPLIDVKYFSIK